MGIEFDEKGKYYTEVISKDVIYTQIETNTHRILGYVYLRKDERLSDALNAENLFLAVTKAKIYDQDGEILYSVDFLAVNRQHITWIMPLGERQDKPD